jgi:hypothetical protein
MTHIKNMLLLMLIAPVTAVACWAIWVYLIQ